MSRLSDLLNELSRQQQMNQPAIVKRSQELGVSLSKGNVSRYLSGKHPGRPQVQTLDAFAKVLDVPLEDLEAAVVPTDGEPYDAPDESRLLTAPQRAAVNEIIRLLADGNRNSNASTPPLPHTQEQDAQGEEAGEKTGDLVDFPPPPPAGKAAALKPDHGSRDVDEWQLGQERGEEPDPIPDYDESQDPDEHDHGGDE